MRNQLVILALILIVFSEFGWSSLSVPNALSYLKTVEKNQRYEEKIPLMNTGDEPLRVKISHVDYLYHANGETHFVPPASTPRSNATWMSLSHNFIEVPPKNTVYFSYKIEVPNDENLKGTYWSLLLIEPISSPLPLPQEENSIGLQTLIRYGVQIITNVGKIEDPHLKISNKHLERAENEKVIGLFDIENDGSWLLDPQMIVDVFDQKGICVAHLIGRKFRILPNCSVKFDIDFSLLTSGNYKAMVILDSGDDGLFGAEYDLKI